MMEHDRSGLLMRSQYFMARMYRPHNHTWGAILAISFVLCFAYWLAILSSCLDTYGKRYAFVLLFGGTALSFYIIGELQVTRTTAALLRPLVPLPLLAFTLVCLGLKVRRRYQGREARPHAFAARGVFQLEQPEPLWLRRLTEWGPDAFLILVCTLMTVSVSYLRIHIGLRFYLLYVTFLVVELVIHIRSCISDGWYLLDVLLVMSSIWLCAEYIRITDVMGGGHFFGDAGLNERLSLVFLSYGPILQLPFSVVVFLLTVRLLRFVNIFPVMSVPWRTFVRSLTEVMAFFFIFCVIVLVRTSRAQQASCHSLALFSSLYTALPAYFH
jgi:hypothetical protein